MQFRQRNRQPAGAPAPDLRQRPSTTAIQGLTASPPRLNSREFRKARTQVLADTVARLDAAVDEQTRRQLAEWIAGHYAVEYGGAIPLGFLATCYLGPPYVDHRLSLLETIVEHYGPSDPVPEPFAQARSLVRSGAYRYVEIYSDGQLVPVLKDGSVVTP
ncbi:MAG TPA: hypothetical protein VGX23_23385 [Actinocrinis sp.]|nr:hypothetical protein [Actinocrinis sp.]